MALSYTTVARVYNVEPLLQTVTNLTSAQVFQFASDAEADVDAKLSKLYTVPVPGTPPILASIATDLTCYRILSRRIFTAERMKDSPWPKVFKEAMETLNDIASGMVQIVASGTGIVIGGKTTGAVATSTTENYLPTFTELPYEDATIDRDKIDDLEDDRDDKDWVV